MKNNPSIENSDLQRDIRSVVRQNQKIAIIVSRYHHEVTDSLLHAARETLLTAGLTEGQILVVPAPGTWEIPLVTQWALRSTKVIAAIALGVVIRGETSHDQHINRYVSLALGRLSLKTDLPVAFGVLTCNDMNQALARSGGAVGNKGSEAAAAVLDMLRVKSSLK